MRNNEPIQSQNSSYNELFLKIWETEYAHQQHRWTVTTFFIGISFAILGFSFQTKLPFLELLFMRIFGISVYWFGCVLYVYRKKQSTILRNYLTQMETSGQVQFDIQRTINNTRPKKITSTELLIFFGIFYTVLVSIACFLPL
jgi:hypothetical protein